MKKERLITGPVYTFETKRIYFVHYDDMQALFNSFMQKTPLQSSKQIKRKF